MWKRRLDGGAGGPPSPITTGCAGSLATDSAPDMLSLTACPRPRYSSPRGAANHPRGAPPALESSIAPLALNHYDPQVPACHQRRQPVEAGPAFRLRGRMLEYGS